MGDANIGDWNYVISEVPSTSSHSVTLRFYDGDGDRGQNGMKTPERLTKNHVQICHW